MLNKQVKATFKNNKTIEGKVIDITTDGKYLEVETSEDIYKVNTTTVTVEEVTATVQIETFEGMEVSYTDEVKTFSNVQFTFLLEENNDEFYIEIYDEEECEVVESKTYKRLADVKKLVRKFK